MCGGQCGEAPREDTMVKKQAGRRVIMAKEVGICFGVKRAINLTRQALAERYDLVILGDRNHAEIKGILGALEHPALVVHNVEELLEAKENRKLMRKVGVIFQTTHALELCNSIVNEMLMMCKEIQIINTICRPVQNRQDDAVELASKVELMIVVGSRTSANTMELAALCRHHNPNTIHVQSAEELSYESFKDCEVIGLASGLSTPEDLVEAVKV